MDEKKTVVISVGGSLIVPDKIDTSFLRKLKSLITHEMAANGRRFIIIAGGGKTARQYQDAAAEVTELSPDDLDWIGIHATRLNGHLLSAVFRELAHPEMITNPDDILKVPKKMKLIVAAGHRPGASTDLRAVQIAKLRNAKKVINLSNIDYVYTADPKKDFAAEKIEDITWEEFQKLIPSEWDPGLSMPFDPVAAEMARKEDTEVVVMNGNKLSELENYFKEKPFVGTRIHT